MKMLNKKIVNRGITIVIVMVMILSALVVVMDNGMITTTPLSNTNNKEVTPDNLLVNSTISNITVSGMGVNLGAITYDPYNNYLYTVNMNPDFGNSVVVINGANNSIVTTIPVGSTPHAITYDSANHYIYVVNYGGDSVSVINTTNIVTTTITVGEEPQGIAYDPANNHLYVSDYYNNEISIINGTSNTVTHNITIGSGAEPWGILFNSFNNHIYVADYGNGKVTIINTTTNTITANITIGSGSEPMGLAYDPSNYDVYIADNGPSVISVVNSTTNTITANITLPSSADVYGVLYDPFNTYIYVANRDANVSIIDGANNSIIGSIPLGAECLAYDSANHYIYATSGETEVFIVNVLVTEEYQITFNEHNLPINTTWTVNTKNTSLLVNTTLTNTTISSGGSVALFLANGTYTATISTSNIAYYCSDSPLKIDVSGIAQTINLTFVKIEPVPIITINSTIPYDTAIIISGSNSYSIHNTTITNYTWKITGKANYTEYGKTISMFFTVLGNYKIELTVNNSVGVTNTTNKSVSVIAPSQDSNIVITYSFKVINANKIDLNVTVNAKDNISISQFLVKVGNIYVNSTLYEKTGYVYYYTVVLTPSKYAYGNYTVVISATDTVGNYNSITTHYTFGSVNGWGMIGYITSNTILLLVIAFVIVAILILGISLEEHKHAVRRIRKTKRVKKR